MLAVKLLCLTCEKGFGFDIWASRGCMLSNIFLDLYYIYAFPVDKLCCVVLHFMKNVKQSHEKKVLDMKGQRAPFLFLFQDRK